MYGVACDESAGMSLAAMELVEDGPVHDASATVRTSTVTDPDGVPVRTTRWMVPANWTRPQACADAVSALAVDVKSPKSATMLRMFWLVVGPGVLAATIWRELLVPTYAALAGTVAPFRVKVDALGKPHTTLPVVGAQVIWPAVPVTLVAPVGVAGGAGLMTVWATDR